MSERIEVLTRIGVDSPVVRRDIRQRPRRLRRTRNLRRMMRETRLRPSQLIQPLFVTHGQGVRNPVRSMPGVHQFSVDQLAGEAEAMTTLRIPAVLLFGLPQAKDATGSESFRPDGVVQRAIEVIKRTVPELVVITDVCLCEYTSHGHCGLLGRAPGPRGQSPEVLNDETLEMKHIRPGNWNVYRSGEGFNTEISEFAQYSHITVLDELTQSNFDIAAALGRDYIIKPDVVVVRHPEPDERLNVGELLVTESESTLAAIRGMFNEKPILHASISCKWTIRSDRAQNIRSEGVTLIKNRKGRLPHVVAVTAEPLPTRIASIALGTGEIDCVYHFALYELEQAAEEFVRESSRFKSSLDLLTTMVQGG